MRSQLWHTLCFVLAILNLVWMVRNGMRADYLMAGAHTALFVSCIAGMAATKPERIRLRQRQRQRGRRRG